MKKLSILLTGLLSVATVMITKAQSADEIIAKHIEAAGGADNWRKINTVKLEGALQVNGTDVTVVRTVAHNKGVRQDISVMGMTGYVTITPTEGWVYMPFQGQSAPEAITADDLKMRQDELDAQGTLVDYKQKGHKAELLGKEAVNKATCYKIKMLLNSGKTETIFIDSASYNLLRVVSTVKANGQDLEQTTDFSDFKKLQEGIVVPMTILVPVGPGGNAELKVNKMEINKPVADSVFKAGS